jgi:hypothetical protein
LVRSKIDLEAMLGVTYEQFVNHVRSIARLFM